jgi:hypothetical protein
MIPYHASIEQGMKKFYDTLSEKDKRRYAGDETGSGWGGVCHQNTGMQSQDSHQRVKRIECPIC